MKGPNYRTTPVPVSLHPRFPMFPSPSVWVVLTKRGMETKKKKNKKDSRVATWLLKLGPLPNFTNHHRRNSPQADVLRSRDVSGSHVLPLENHR
jgi:hypothetical protein